MIASFGDKTTEALFNGTPRRDFKTIPSDIQPVAVRKLDMVNAAATLEDLRSPPGNRLEPIKGDQKGLHSIRVNDQWRIIFRWSENSAEDVEIVDYH